MNEAIYKMSKILYENLIKPRYEGGGGLKTKANVIEYLNRTLGLAYKIIDIQFI